MVSSENRRAESTTPKMALALPSVPRYPIAVCGRCLADGVDIPGDYVRLLCRLLVGIVAVVAGPPQPPKALISPQATSVSHSPFLAHTPYKHPTDTAYQALV